MKYFAVPLYTIRWRWVGMLSQETRKIIIGMLVCVIFCTTTTGCSGSGGEIPTSPDPSAIPDVTNATAQGTGHGGRTLMGLYEVVIDTEELDVTMVPLRSALFHVNLVEDLNNLDAASVSFDFPMSDPAHGIYALDFSFSHPYPDSQYLYGFDARGIMITPGSLEIGTSLLADVDEWRLLYPDGFTRWWNPTEFTDPGLFGFVTGELGSPYSNLLTATVNPFKYFCDYLDKFQPVSDMTVLPLDHDYGRGITYPGSTLTRRFLIKLPTKPGAPAAFNYAVDVSWDYPDPMPPLEVPDDFPMDANMSEAYIVDVEATVNTLYFNPDAGSGGGQLEISAEVYDWQGKSLGNIANEVSTVRIYAPELFDGGLTMDLVSDDGVKATYSIDLTGDAVPVASGQHLVLVRVGSLDYLHYNSFCPVAPAEPISAYQEIILYIPEQVCEPDANNLFDDAQSMVWNYSLQSSLCRIGGDLVDYADYYRFDFGSDFWEQGTATLHTGSAETHLSLYDDNYTKLAEETALGGSASINTVGLCTEGTHYLRVLTHNETEMVQYEIELEAAMEPDPPVFTSGIAGPLYPRNKHEVTYSVEVDSDLPVTYEWKIEHPDGLLTVNLGEGDGNGSVDVIFDPVGIQEGEWLIKCRVDDGHNPPVHAEPYTVWVNGLIYHADLNDTVTGDNKNWFYMSGAGYDGESKWSTGAVTDSLLEGTGRKFGTPNTDCDWNSAHMLISPFVDLPEIMTKAVVVVRHSFDFGEVYNLETDNDWHAYHGGNVKMGPWPVYPEWNTEPLDTIAGRPYWSLVTDPSVSYIMEDQEIFSGTNSQLVTSVFEIDPAEAGNRINIGFAAATSNYPVYPLRGWLIDDVKVYILDDTPNDPPVVGEIDGSDLTPTFDKEMVLTLPADDPDGDSVYYQWYLWDLSYPGNRVESCYYPDCSNDSINFKVQEIIDEAYGYLENSNRYTVLFKIRDAWHPSAVRSDWVVGGGLIFNATWEGGSTDFDYRHWEARFEEGSNSFWYVGWYTHPELPGRGPTFTGGDYEYDASSHGVLISPPIFIPPGFSGVQVGVQHSYEFEENEQISLCQDGGNIHILDGETYMDDFQWNVQPVVLEPGFNGYDCVLISDHEMAGMAAFSDDDNGTFMRFSLHQLDPSWFSNPYGFRIAFAAATGSAGTQHSGWLIDQIYVMGYE